MKSTSVLKFGGSSVSTPERLQRVARIISQHKKKWPNENILVVVSAMGDTTDDLLDLARKVSTQSFDSSRRREMDMLLTAGERISMALLSLALADLNIDAISLTGSQSGIITSDFHGEARIKDIKPIRIEEALSKNKVVIVAGFQGVSEQKEVTTLGRGGSDTSAVSLGARFNAREVYIYTDVDGLYNANPRYVSEARPLEHLDYRQAYLSALLGAQVLHARCLEVAAKFQIPVRVLSSFLNEEDLNSLQFINRGTLIQKQGTKMEKPFVATLNHMDSLSLLNLNCESEPLNEIKNIQNTKLSWVALQNQNNVLKIIFKTSMSADYLKVFPKAQLEKDFELVSLVGYGLTAAPTLSSQIIELFETHGIKASIFQANDDAFVFLIQRHSSNVSNLSEMLPKIDEICRSLNPT